MWSSLKLIILVAILGIVCGSPRRRIKSRRISYSSSSSSNTTNRPTVTHTRSKYGPVAVRRLFDSDYDIYFGNATTPIQTKNEDPTHTTTIAGYYHSDSNVTSGRHPYPTDVIGPHREATVDHRNVTGNHHEVTDYHLEQVTQRIEATMDNKYHFEPVTPKIEATTENKATTTKSIVPVIWESAETPGLNAKYNGIATANRKIDETPEDCSFYKAPIETQFNYDKMADIWQTAHYKLDEKLPCFKIYIRKITEDERNAYKKKYGTFDNRLNWDHVFLEVRALSDLGRKHFLQGTNEGKGVMTNIIISEEINHHALREESANQWLVVRQLLIMRDCDAGGYIAFSKVPHTPSKIDLNEALKDFGEQYRLGVPVCEDDEDERSNAAEASYEPNENYE